MVVCSLSLRQYPAAWEHIFLQSPSGYFRLVLIGGFFQPDMTSRSYLSFAQFPFISVRSSAVVLMVQNARMLFFWFAFWEEEEEPVDEGDGNDGEVKPKEEEPKPK